MFIAEFMCLFFFVIVKFYTRNKKIVNNPKRPNKASQYIKEFGLFFGFSMLDLTGSILATIGLMMVNSSIYQLFRGSIVIFTGIWSIVFLHRKLNYQHWMGMIVVVLGLFFVGLSGFMNAINGKEDLGAGWKFLLGILLIAGGQVASGFHFVCQEKYLKVLDLNPLYVIGCEGLFGTLVVSLICFPIVSAIPGSDCNKYENVADGYVMMTKSGMLLAWNLVSLVSMALFNALGLVVSKHLSCIHRTLIDACRSIAVWGAMLVVFYASKSDYGEPWDKYSYFQIVGFGFLVLGTLLYNRVFVLDRALNAVLGREYFRTEEQEKERNRQEQELKQTAADSDAQARAEAETDRLTQLNVSLIRSEGGANASDDRSVNE